MKHNIQSIRLFLSALVLFCTTINLNAQSLKTLFDIIPSAERVLSESEGSRYASISEELIMEKELIDISRFSQVLTESTLLVPLNGKNYSMISEVFTKEKEGNFTYKGRFSELTGELFLYSTNGYVYGNIHLDSLSYQIEPLNKKYALLLRRDYSELTCPMQEGNDEGRKSKSINNNPVNIPTIQSSDPVIDVMVLFSNQAAAATTDMQALAEASIQSSNDSFINSNASVTFNLVHYQQISYSESGYMDFDRDRMVNPFDGYMDNVHTIREQYSADVVMLIVSEGRYSINNAPLCGIAYDIGVSSVGAFAVTADDCSVGNYTFAHEIGHLAGARHDNDSNTSPYIYGHGFKYLPAYWRTIMATNAGSINTYRIPYWSNPDKYYGGIAMGTNSWNDNARVWDVRASIMADFKSLEMAVNIFGPTTLYSGQTGFWAAGVSNGTTPYSYQWQKRNSGSSYWYNIGTNSSYSGSFTNDVDLKVIVTDSINDTATDIISVSVSGAIPKVIGGESNAIPEIFGLAQNYPNPFNPSTNVQFELPEQAQVSIVVFNIMGQRVSTLVDQTLNAGFHTYTFDASGLPSGVYIAQNAANQIA